jgi:hypothetical protein
MNFMKSISDYEFDIESEFEAIYFQFKLGQKESLKIVIYLKKCLLEILINIMV